MDDNVKQRQGFETSTTKVTIEETFEFTKTEFENMSIAKKFSAMWNQQYLDLSMFKYSYLAGLCLFLYLSISELYILRNYVISELIEDVETRYWFKVGCCFLWYISTAHWLCVLLYNSYWIPNNEDQPLLADKTLWDDYDETLEAMQEKRIIDKSSKDTTKYVNRMVNYLPAQQNGLRWRYCVICQLDSPPRAHHCVLCNICILKRDHHCYMTGRCIGYKNQKYFFFFCFYSLLCGTIGMVFEGYYILYVSKIGIQSWWSGLFILNTVYQWLWTGEIETHLFVITTHLYTFPFIAAMCFGFVCLQTAMILRGLTSDEMKHSEKVKVNYGFIQRWQDVFGEYWLLNFIMPSQILFKQRGDGINWPGIINLSNLASQKQSA